MAPPEDGELTSGQANTSEFQRPFSQTTAAASSQWTQCPIQFLGDQTSLRTAWNWSLHSALPYVVSIQRVLGGRPVQPAVIIVQASIRSDFWSLALFSFSVFFFPFMHSPSGLWLFSLFLLLFFSFLSSPATSRLSARSPSSASTAS